MAETEVLTKLVNDPALQELNARLETVFEATLDSQLDIPEQEGHQQASRKHLWNSDVIRSRFWSLVYQRRESERVKFKEALLDTSVPLLLVTGQVGCGKSTFVLEKIEHRTKTGDSICTGVYVDLERYQGELWEAERDARKTFGDYARAVHPEPVSYNIFHILKDVVSSRLESIVTRKVKEHVYQHFIMLFHNSGRWEKYLRLDLFSGLYCDLERPEKTEANSYAQSAKAAVAAFLVISSVEDPEHQRIYSAALKEPIDENLNLLTGQFEVVRKFLEQQDQAVINRLLDIGRKISGRPPDQMWLRAYSLFFNHESSIIFLDNGDCLDHADMHRVLKLYAEALGSTAREWKNEDGRPPKVVLSLRENNLTSFRSPSEGRRTFRPIVLAKKPYGFEPENSGFYGLTKKCMSDIIEKRLQLCSEIFASEAMPDKVMGLFQRFCKVARNVWVKAFNDPKVFDPFSKGTPLVDLTNESIRIGLSMVRHSSIIMVASDCASEESSSTWINYERHRSHHADASIIGWLFEGGNSGPSLRQYVRREREIIRGGNSFCCAHRMILTYLFNKMRRHRSDVTKTRVPVYRLAEKLQREIGIDEKQALDALWFLYKPGDIHCVYISIEQATPLGNLPDDDIGSARISRHGDVYINRRGEVLIRRIVQTIDYWARLEHGSAIEVASAFDRDPESMVDFAEPIVKSVEAIARAHIRNWRDLVRSRDDWRTLPFKEFSSEYSIGGAFFIERVANSHFELLRKYLSCVLHNLVNAGEIHEGDRTEMEKDIDLLGMESIKDRLKDSLWGGRVVELVNFGNRYRKIASDLGALKQRTRADFM